MNPGDDSFLRELIQIYLEDSPQRIAEIELSLEQADAIRLTRPRTASRQLLQFRRPATPGCQ